MLEDRGPTEGKQAATTTTEMLSFSPSLPEEAKLVVTNSKNTLVLRDKLDPTNGMAVLAVEKIDLP